MEYLIPYNLKGITDCIAHISKFPNVDAPQIFSFHGSSDITFCIKEFNELLTTITTALQKMEVVVEFLRKKKLDLKLKLYWIHSLYSLLKNIIEIKLIFIHLLILVKVLKFLFITSCYKKLRKFKIY